MFPAAAGRRNEERTIPQLPSEARAVVTFSIHFCFETPGKGIIVLLMLFSFEPLFDLAAFIHCCLYFLT